MPPVDWEQNVGSGRMKGPGNVWRTVWSAAVVANLASVSVVLGQASLAEYETCFDRGNSDMGKLLFACSRVIGDSAQPATIRSEALRIRGQSYSNTRAYDQALSDLTEAIRLNPTGVNAYISRGFAYLRKDDKDRAIIDLRKALSLAPPNFKETDIEEIKKLLKNLGADP